jgi:hypothetical protein
MNDDTRKFSPVWASWKSRGWAGVHGLMRRPEQMHISGHSEMMAKELLSRDGSWSDHVRPELALVTDEYRRC